MAISHFLRMRAIAGREQTVEDELLANMRRVRAARSGNLACVVHRSRQDPREFWVYETWVDLDAIQQNESSAEFTAHKERLLPVVEAESILFGDAEPLTAPSARSSTNTLPERFTHALGTGDRALLEELYDPDVSLYTPLGWPIHGLNAVQEFVGQFHAGYPGLRVTLHDQFFSADGQRVCFRFVIHYENRGQFGSSCGKTCSGKITRRLLRDVTEGRELGDVSTLGDPTVVITLKSRIAVEGRGRGPWTSC